MSVISTPRSRVGKKSVTCSSYWVSGSVMCLCAEFSCKMCCLLWSLWGVPPPLPACSVQPHELFAGPWTHLYLFRAFAVSVPTSCQNLQGSLCTSFRSLLIYSCNRKAFTIVCKIETQLPQHPYLTFFSMALVTILTSYIFTFYLFLVLLKYVLLSFVHTCLPRAWHNSRCISLCYHNQLGQTIYKQVSITQSHQLDNGMCQVAGTRRQRNPLLGVGHQEGLPGEKKAGADSTGVQAFVMQVLGVDWHCSIGS